MKRGSLIFALLLLSAATFAQTKERTVAEFEVETGIDRLEKRTSFNIEARYNFHAPWDIGIKARLDYISMIGNNVHPTFDIVGDYNFRRGKPISFFAGAGAGVSTYEDDNYLTSKTMFHLMPRAGIELVNHIRLTGYFNFFDMKYTGAGLNAGVVFGGSRLENKSSNTYHFEFEPYVGISSYGDYTFGFEARYNFCSPWDIGINACMDFAGSRISAVGDYNFSRNDIATIFCGVGAGYAHTDILDECYSDDMCGCGGTMSDLFFIHPRLGIELAEHMRFTIGTNIYNFKKAELLLTIGVAIGGGRN